MTITGTFYTSKEIQNILSCSKQRVSNLAKEQEWQSPYPGLYNTQDVTEYFLSRWRMELAREFGETVTGLVTHDDWDKDDNCPVCNSFAIWKPATPDQVADIEQQIYVNGWPWRCIKGHSG